MRVEKGTYKECICTHLNNLLQIHRKMKFPGPPRENKVSRSKVVETKRKIRHNQEENNNNWYLFLKSEGLKTSSRS